MQDYIRVAEVKEGCYVEQVLDIDNTILFNVTNDIRQAYQVPTVSFTEFILESKGRESFETRLLNSTHGKIKMFKQETNYIEQPEGLTSVVDNKRINKEEK